MYSVFFDKTLLPVTPGKLEMTIHNQNKTTNLLDGSAINLLKRPGLTEIALTIELPQTKRPYARYREGFQPAKDFLEAFETYKVEAKPFQLIVVRTLPTGGQLHYTNMQVSLEEYKILEDRKDTGLDLQVEIKLKQYVPYGTKVAKITRPEPKKEEPEPPKVQPKKERPPSKDLKPTIGSEVIVNGVLHWDSWGARPGQTRTNWRGKISHINLSGSHPYHVTTMDGLWQGWVLASAIEVVA